MTLLTMRFEDGSAASADPVGVLFEVGPDQTEQVLHPLGALRIGCGGVPEIFADMRFKHLRHQPVHGTPNRGDLLQDRSAVCARLQRPPSASHCPRNRRTRASARFFSCGECGMTAPAKYWGQYMDCFEKAMPSGLLTVVLLSAITAPRWQMGMRELRAGSTWVKRPPVTAVQHAHCAEVATPRTPQTREIPSTTMAAGHDRNT